MTINNEILQNTVTLNESIVANAKQQFLNTGIEKTFALKHSYNNLQTEATLEVDPLTAKVATQVISGQIQYQISTTGSSKGWTLSLVFDLNKNENTIPYVVLSYSVLDKVQELTFQQVNKTSITNQYKATLTINTLVQRDTLLNALSDIQSNTTLAIAFRTDSSLLNTITDPQTFLFAPKLYPYIYNGILPPPPSLSLKKFPIEFNDFWYNYYQNVNNSAYLYYLPDSFNLALDPEKSPMLSMYFEATKNATSLKDVNVTFNYLVVPKIDKKRISKATEVFQKTQKGGQLIPLSNFKSASLSLSLPSGKIIEKNALIDLQSGIVDSFTIPSADFAKIWDALFDTSPQSILLKGNLSIALQGFNPNKIPVSLNLPAHYKDMAKQLIKQPTPVDIQINIKFTSNPTSYTQKNDNGVLITSILVNVGNKTIELNKKAPTKDVMINVSVLELILTPDQGTTYHYDLQIFYSDNTSRTLNNLSSTFEIIHVP
ncbi:hypothetical protein AADZ91_02885 [Colwelliaceae bacterium 6441]